MKALIAALVLFSSSIAVGTPVPVYDATGPAVVVTPPAPAPTPAPTPAPKTVVPVAPVQEPTPTYNNRVVVYGGYGPDGVNVSIDKTKNTVSVTPFSGPLVGVGYERLFAQKWSVSAEALWGASVYSTTVIGAVGVGYGW